MQGGVRKENERKDLHSYSQSQARAVLLKRESERNSIPGHGCRMSVRMNTYKRAHS